jgi:hypothetical protein
MGTDAWDLILAVYVAAIPSRLAPVGGAITGNMRRRTIAMTAPQQRQSSLGRSVGGTGADGARALPQVLNTSKRSNAIKRLLLGCKNP